MRKRFVLWALVAVIGAVVVVAVATRAHSSATGSGAHTMPSGAPMTSPMSGGGTMGTDMSTTMP